jgi:hypothetical protein
MAGALALERRSRADSAPRVVRNPHVPRLFSQAESIAGDIDDPVSSTVQPLAWLVQSD